MDEQIGGWMDVYMDGWVGKCRDGRMDGWLTITITYSFILFVPYSELAV